MTPTFDQLKAAIALYCRAESTNARELEWRFPVDNSPYNLCIYVQGMWDWRGTDDRFEPIIWDHTPKLLDCLVQAQTVWTDKLYFKVFFPSYVAVIRDEDPLVWFNRFHYIGKAEGHRRITKGELEVWDSMKKIWQGKRSFLSI